MPTGKILIVRGGAIGDFILTLPVLAALRERFPDVHLEVLGYPRVTSLAVAGGLAHRAQSIEARALASFFARNGPLPPELAEYFARFAVIVSYLYDPDEIFRENVRRCSAAQFLAGPHRPDESSDAHATEVFLRPLERLAIFDADPTPRLKIPEGHPSAQSAPAVSASNGSSPNLWLAMHPGSGSERKNWPENHWRGLIRILADRTRVGFLLVGGEAEVDRLKRLAEALPADRRRLVQGKPLLEVAQALQSCRAFLGHDSGISHLGAALGLPGVLLWGETRQQVWRPRTERMRLLESPGGLAALTVDQVLAALAPEWLV